MSDHKHDPLTREDVLETVYAYLIAGAEHVMEGRTTEGVIMNNLAQTALALAAHLLPSQPQNTEPVH